MFVLWLASFFSLCTSSLAASAPSQNPPYILDPLNSPSHGVIFSPNHVVLKVDCPGCPVFDNTWNAKATSLIFDFELASLAKDPTKPLILLNGDSFFPRAAEPGWTGFTAHTGRPVPWTTTLEEYIAAPTAYNASGIVAGVSSCPVNNTLGRNLTAVLFFTIAYGSDHNNTFENFEGNVSAIELFYETTAYWSETQDQNGTITHAGTREYWSLEWWQIVPVSLLSKVVTEEPLSIEIPSALKYKLQGYVPTVLGCGTTSCSGLQPALQDLLGWVHFLGAVVIIAIIVGVATGVWWYFGDEILKLPIWEDLRKWWDERMQKKGEADGGENAPLLAGGQDDED